MRHRRPFAPKHKCNGKHCELIDDSCRQPACKGRQEQLLRLAKSDNTALSTTLDELVKNLIQLRTEIFEACKTDHFTSEEMENSRLALVRVNRKKVALLFCECTACQLDRHQQQSTLLNERRAAAEHRLTAIKEFRLAHDKETLSRTSSSFAKGGKYFTPVGSTKAKGITALRPTLQMQSSYDVAALTTNTMAKRPMKIAWKDKPKPMRIVNMFQPAGKDLCGTR